MTVYGRLVLRHAVRPERLDTAEDMGRGDRSRCQGQGQGQVPLGVGQGAATLLPDDGRQLRHQVGAATTCASRSRTSSPAAGSKAPVQDVFSALGEMVPERATSSLGGAGTQFTAAQAKWSNDEQGDLLPVRVAGSRTR